MRNGEGGGKRSGTLVSSFMDAPHAYMQGGAVSISARRGGGKYGNISRFVSPDDHLDYAAGINIRYR